jgi:hypothetical protein
MALGKRVVSKEDGAPMVGIGIMGETAVKVTESDCKAVRLGGLELDSGTRAHEENRGCM